jgi:hypothetical protein
MKTSKYQTDYQACAHAFAYANKSESGENYGRRMFFYNDIMYSYGHHFIIAKKIRDKSGNTSHVLFNSNSHSVTTSKQQNCVRSAIRHFEVIGVGTRIDNFCAKKEILHIESEIIESAKKLARARTHHTRNSYTSEILRAVQRIHTILKYYRVKSKLPVRIKRLLNADSTERVQIAAHFAEVKVKSDKIASIKAEKEKRRKQKEYALKIAKQVKEWKANEIEKIHLPHYMHDILRISKDKTKIETSQGISIGLEEAKTMIKLIERSKLIGYKVQDRYLVTKMNGILSAGCHNIERSEINSIIEEIPL